MSNTWLTPAQNEARKRAIELLSEHFDSWVLLVETELDEPVPEEGLRTFWCGAYQGNSAAIGLMEKYKHQMLHDKDDP